MARFELISKYADHPELLPRRATDGSAGYDFIVAEDTLIPSWNSQSKKLEDAYFGLLDITRGYYNLNCLRPLTLEETARITKSAKAKPTLVPTGIKCKLEKDKYLQLFVRSSTPLKYWLILANAEGIIDSDYYNNEDNEGHIFFQLINLAPFDIQLLKGDRIGQGVIGEYDIADNDIALIERRQSRIGGFGSTL